MDLTLAERALQTTTSSDPPFFPTGLVPPTQTSASSHKQELPKSILEWLFFVIAVVLITTVLTCRSCQLRRQNRPLSEFFSISQNSRSNSGRPRRIPRTTGLPPLNGPLRPISLTHAMLYPPPSPLPAAYRSNGRRTRAADTDAGGRRAGNPEDDHKDMLPAYDNIGGPPKYVEINMDPGTQLHLDLAGVVERERSSSTPDEQDTPRQSAEEVTSNSGSHSFHRSSDRYESNHRQSGSDTPALDPLAAHHSV